MTPPPDADFEALLAFLRDSRGFDFTGYKRASLMRRVEHRMGQLRIASYTDYQDHLALNADEFTALFDTVLINVTDFFRDPEAWEVLASDLLPELLARRNPDSPIRVWSAGCATGEEPYSVASVLADLLGPEAFRARVKIYATDVDEGALSIARTAAYGEQAMRGVPPEVRARHFDQVGTRWTVRPELRRAVIFGRNELVSDAPISRVDLLLCRNTLMYFNAETQARVLSRLHFALAPTGVLFLGKAEMLLSHGTLFTPIDLRRRFFRKVPRASPLQVSEPARGGVETIGLEELRRQALAASPIATLLINGEGALVGTNPRADSLFALAPSSLGRPLSELEVSFRPLSLAAPIDQALAERRPVWVRGVEWTRGPDERLVLDMLVAPLSGAEGEPLGLTVMANDVTRFADLQLELEAANRQLEAAYEELQSTVEELETTNEELQSTVEELETTNEELQSTNEELETMNEEQQSTNDELQSINDELQERTEEVRQASEFLTAILSALRSGVVVLDPGFEVRIWNIGAEEMWGLRADEVVGKHLLSLDSGLPGDALAPMIHRLLDGGNGGELRLAAVNRRGRTIRIRVVGTALAPTLLRTGGAVLVMDELDGSDEPVAADA